MKGGGTQIDTPQKKPPSKFPALLGLNYADFKLIIIVKCSSPFVLLIQKDLYFAQYSRYREM